MATYTLIKNDTLTSAQASYTFTSIPQTYTDLLIKTSIRVNEASQAVEVAFRPNGTGANASSRILYGTGTSAYSESGNLNMRGTATGTDATANTFASTDLYIPNYTGSTYKSMSFDTVTENNSGASGYWYGVLAAGLWSDTSAITSMQIIYPYADFLTGSSFSLYGIKKD